MREIFTCPGAFDVFFTERVRIDAEREGGRVSGGYRAAVYPGADDEAILEGSIQSTRQVFTVLIPASGEGGWNLAALGTRPQIGDKLTLADGTVLHITKAAQLIGDHFEIEARG